MYFFNHLGMICSYLEILSYNITQGPRPLLVYFPYPHGLDGSTLHPCSQWQEEEKEEKMSCLVLLEDTRQRLSTSLSKAFHWPEFCYMVIS